MMTSYQQSFCKTAVYTDVELFIPNRNYEVLNRDPLNRSYWTVLSFGAVYPFKL